MLASFLVVQRWWAWFVTSFFVAQFWWSDFAEIAFCGADLVIVVQCSWLWWPSFAGVGVGVANSFGGPVL